MVQVNTRCNFFQRVLPHRARPFSLVSTWLVELQIASAERRQRNIHVWMGRRQLEQIVSAGFPFVSDSDSERERARAIDLCSSRDDRKPFGVEGRRLLDCFHPVTGGVIN